MKWGGGKGGGGKENARRKVAFLVAHSKRFHGVSVSVYRATRPHVTAACICSFKRSAELSSFVFFRVYVYK